MKFALKIVRYTLSSLLSKSFIEQIKYQLLNKYNEIVKKIKQNMKNNKSYFIYNSIKKMKKCNKYDKIYYYE